jgi:hypothetical protein
VTLPVTVNTISGQIGWREIMLMSREHRLSLTGSRWDILWLSGRGKTPTLCVFPVFGAAVMEKCCDTCSDR